MRNDKMQGPHSCILIVEDKAIIAYCFERSLKVWARRRGVVPSGEEAIQKAIEGRPDLVLMGIEYAVLPAVNCAGSYTFTDP